MIRRRNSKPIVVVVVAVGLTLAFVGTCASYRSWSATALPLLTDNLGNVAMQQAARYEASGDLSEALNQYHLALEGYLPGERDRVHAEKRIGTILRIQGDYEGAVVHLERAQASPLRSLSGYKLLVDSLEKAGRRQEAESVAATWLRACVEEGREGAGQAEVLLVLGRQALRRDDRGMARDFFEWALRIVPDHEAMIELAKIHRAEGNEFLAETTLVEFLAWASPGAVADDALTLLRKWKS